MSAALSLPGDVPAGSPRDRLIIGLDVGSVAEARSLVDRIGEAGAFYKIGYQLAYAGGYGAQLPLLDYNEGFAQMTALLTDELLKRLTDASA